MIDAFVACGGNFIDSADVYNGGASEKVLGNWIAKHADKRDGLVAVMFVMSFNWLCAVMLCSDVGRPACD